jgi:hypothetical protein
MNLQLLFHDYLAPRCYADLTSKIFAPEFVYLCRRIFVHKMFKLPYKLAPSHRYLTCTLVTKKDKNTMKFALFFIATFSELQAVPTSFLSSWAEMYKRAEAAPAAESRPENGQISSPIAWNLPGEIHENEEQYCLLC